MSGELDCQSCGACCKAHPNYEGRSYVKIYDQDFERLTDEQREKYTVTIPLGSSEASGYSYLDNWLQRGAMRLVEDKKCAALTGEIGNCVGCDIYDNRPDVCRGFEKGDDSCHFARMEAGLGPFGG